MDGGLFAEETKPEDRLLKMGDRLQPYHEAAGLHAVEIKAMTQMELTRRLSRRADTEHMTRGKLTSKEMARRAGVTLRQLQWWDEHGVIRPILFMHKRLFDSSQARTVRVVAELRGKGVSLQRIRKALPRIEQAPAGTVLIFAGQSRVRIVSRDSALQEILMSSRPVSAVEIP